MAGKREPTSWAPVANISAALRPPEPPTILRAVGGGALLYPGTRHLLSGESEALKSWTAAAATAEVLTAGRAVVWIDTDDMGLGAVVERLGLLGVAMKHIEAALLYVSPDGPLDAAGAEDLGAAMSSHGDVALAVIDALDPALELHDMEPNSTRDVQRFYRTVVGQFHRQGITSLLIDHVTKDAAARGRNAIGSQRKSSGTDVHLGVELVGDPMTRTVPRGKVVIRGFKDRPGWHERDGRRAIGTLAFDLSGEQDAPWQLRLGGEAVADLAAEFRPTHLMERVSRFLEGAAEPVSQRGIEDGVKGKGTAVRRALDLLVGEGYVVRKYGTRGAHMHTSVKAYRETDEVRPDRVPTASRTHSATASPEPSPSRREGRGGTRSEIAADGAPSQAPKAGRTQPGRARRQVKR